MSIPTVNRFAIWVEYFIARATLKGHVELVKLVIFADSKTVASVERGGRIKLWDVATQTEIATFNHSVSINSIVFSPDGKTIAIGSENKTIKLWNVATQTEIATLAGYSASINSVIFSPDGKLLMSREDQKIELWHVPQRDENLVDKMI